MLLSNPRKVVLIVDYALVVEGGTQWNFWGGCGELIWRHWITNTEGTSAKLIFGLLQAKLGTLRIQEFLCKTYRTHYTFTFFITFNTFAGFFLPSSCCWWGKSLVQLVGLSELQMFAGGIHEINCRIYHDTFVGSVLADGLFRLQFRQSVLKTKVMVPTNLVELWSLALE